MIKKMITNAAYFLVLMVLFAACKPQKTINQNYFSKDKPDSSHSRIWQNYETQIQPKDKISVYVTALNPASAQIYNLTSGTGVQGYTVDEKGNILLPQLGFIHAAGLTKNQLRDTLLSKLRTFLTDPVVVVDFINLKITILGEVKSQGSVSMNDGKITILQALGNAGDIQENGRRDSILVIRESNGKREFGYINLLSNESFKSPYFVLEPNDVVYVPMIKSKSPGGDKEGFAQKVLPVLTVLTSLTSLFWLIYSFTR